MELTQHVEEVDAAGAYVPESKPVDALLSRDAGRRQHIAVVVDEYGGTAGLITDRGRARGDRRRDHRRVRRRTRSRSSALVDGSSRVPSRSPDRRPRRAVSASTSRRRTSTAVGGLTAKHLGRVPIPGSAVEAHGLRFDGRGDRRPPQQVGAVLTAAAERPDEARRAAAILGVDETVWHPAWCDAPREAGAVDDRCRDSASASRTSCCTRSPREDAAAGRRPSQTCSTLAEALRPCSAPDRIAGRRSRCRSAMCWRSTGAGAGRRTAGGHVARPASVDDLTVTRLGQSRRREKPLDTHCACSSQE